MQVHKDNIYDLIEQSRRPAPIGGRTSLPIKEDAQGRIFIAGLAEVHAAANRTQSMSTAQSGTASTILPPSAEKLKVGALAFDW